MKNRLMMITIALLASLTCLPANAQSGPSTGGTSDMGPRMGAGMGPVPAQLGNTSRVRPPRDCSLSTNPAACNAHREARAKAADACKDNVGPQRRQCMQQQMQNFDCAKAGNPQQCEARKVAYKECQGQTGPAFRQCVQQKIPATDCSKAPNPARCEQHQKARVACQDKLGPEHKACLRQQFNVQ